MISLEWCPCDQEDRQRTTDWVSVSTTPGLADKVSLLFRSQRSLQDSPSSQPATSWRNVTWASTTCDLLRENILSLSIPILIFSVAQWIFDPLCAWRHGSSNLVWQRTIPNQLFVLFFYSFPQIIISGRKNFSIWTHRDIMNVITRCRMISRMKSRI